VRHCPKLAGGADAVEPGTLPPCGLITELMNFAMMAAAKRDGELIADLA
jgi:hypothetical protein